MPKHRLSDSPGIAMSERVRTMGIALGGGHLSEADEKIFKDTLGLVDVEYDQVLVEADADFELIAELSTALRGLA